MAAVLAITVGLAVFLRNSGAAPHNRDFRSSGKPPIVEQLVFAPIGMDRARQINAGIPFATDRGPPARPFHLKGDGDSRERATDCLASAMWYEAGNDPAGQAAVGQVVLNRLRHPAYPKSVCGVVFQGSERNTGCQFTFTCDGSLARQPSAASWAAARANASAMLSGKVDPAPGLATHYHTDWVHPLWSARLDKIARVGTHLFFRWHGAWGQAGAFRQTHGGQEPAIARLASLSHAHMLAAGTGDELADKAFSPASGNPGGIAEIGDGNFFISMSVARNSNVQGMAALETCGERDWCKVIGRNEGSAAPVFLFLRDRRNGVERALWDCMVFKRPTTTQCFTPENRIWLSHDGKSPPVR